MYKCKYCGKEFDNKQKLGGHVTRCTLNPNFENNKKQIEIAREKINRNNLHLHCQYCGKEIANKGCLTIHEQSCIQNPKHTKNPNRNGNGGLKNGHSCKWKGTNKFNNPSIQKRINTYKIKYNNGEYKNLGHKHTEETKQHLREVFENKIKEQKGSFKCFYAKRACKYIDKLNEEKHWNLQHAENGGEVNCLGYWLDGYDKELNIVFEYDEPKHYKDVINNILKDKDIQRQNNIINKLNCQFWRYNEYLDLLYKVN